MLASLVVAPVLAAQQLPPPKAVPVAEVAEEPAQEVAEGAAEAVRKPGETGSRSGQFLVRGSGLAERGSVAVLAEDTKRDMLRLLAAEDEWKSKVVIELHGRPGDPRPERTVAQDLFVTDQGFRLQLDVNLSRGIEHDRFKYAVLSTLIYEWSLRGRGKEIAGERLRVRPWLIEGLQEAIRWKAGRSNRELYQAMFERGGVFELEELLNVGGNSFDGFDAATRSAFRVSAGALVMALLGQGEGRGAFQAMLREVAVFEGETPLLLRRHFPGLNLSERSLAKWWALQMANMAESPLVDVLGVAETERALSAALRLHLTGEEGPVVIPGLDEWPRLAGMPEAERAEAVRGAQDALVRLSYRCFPSFRPLIIRYQKILQELAEGRGKQISARLAELDEQRVLMVERTGQGRDYLDWFEITRASDVSGDFADYLLMKESLRRPPDHAEDPLSLYLDDLQEAFER